MHISREGADQASILIDEKLSHLSHISSEAESCIFRVHCQLRKVNEEAYEPVLVAIGPYHRGKANLQEMEKHKLRYLQQVLKRREETSVDRYIKAIRELEERARQYYAETITLDTNEFVEMMLLDGCFIVELFRKNRMRELRDRNDPVFLAQILFGLARDLILLENQLPFFVLVEFFNMTKVLSPRDNIIEMALYFVEDIVPSGSLKAQSEILIDEIKHLLGLVHDSLCFSFAKDSRNVKDKVESYENINSATELEEAGIKFKKAERSNLFDIEFINGVLEIPSLNISEYIESPFRNLIAYEQYFVGSNQPHYVCDYIAFIDCLINSPKDVQLLRRRGVIINQVGDDKVVHAMLNEMIQFIVISTKKDFSFSNIFSEVNKHCGRRRNEWMATLRRNYFNNPWAWVSFLAAVVLLLLTVIQTIFSGFSLNLK